MNKKNTEFEKLNNLTRTTNIKELFEDEDFIKLLKTAIVKIFNSKYINDYNVDDLFQDIFRKRYVSMLKYDAKFGVDFSYLLYNFVKWAIKDHIKKCIKDKENDIEYKAELDKIEYLKIDEIGELHNLIKSKLYNFEYKIFSEKEYGYKIKEIAKINKTDASFIKRKLIDIKKKLREDSDIIQYYKDSKLN